MISSRTVTLCGVPVVVTVVSDLFPGDRAYILGEPPPANYANALLDLGAWGVRLDLGEQTPPPGERVITEVAFRGRRW